MSDLDNKSFNYSDEENTIFSTREECVHCEEEGCLHSHCRLISWDMDDEFDCPNCKSDCRCDFIKQLRKYKKQKKIIKELKARIKELKLTK